VPSQPSGLFGKIKFPEGYNKIMIMPGWLWAVNGVLWFFAVGLTGMGIWKLLFKSRKLSNKAELNAFVGWNEISKIYALDKKR